MRKKILLGVAALGVTVLVLPMFAAFEAHVVNVTATIENALAVSPNELQFGTVFPQEVLVKNVTMQFSGSFIADPTADDVEYKLKQKPKCGVPIPQTDPVQYSQFVQVTEDAQGNFVCPMVDVVEGPDVQSVALPFLCPFLSKTETTVDNNPNVLPLGPVENDGSPVGTFLTSFHGPLSGWTDATSEQYAVAGKLQRSVGDRGDRWDIDLHTPCFSGQCSQDWADYVHGANLNADPAAYMLNSADEHKLFGCDLWFEVTGVSRLQQPT